MDTIRLGRTAVLAAAALALALVGTTSSPASASAPPSLYSWTPAAHLAAHGGADGMSNEATEPVVALSADGTRAVMAWNEQSFDPPGHGQTVYAATGTVSGRTVTWSAAQLLSGLDENDVPPLSLAFARGGTTVAVSWFESTNSGPLLHAVVGTWTPDGIREGTALPENVVGPWVPAWSPDIAVTDDGTEVALGGVDVRNHFYVQRIAVTNGVPDWVGSPWDVGEVQGNTGLDISRVDGQGVRIAAAYTTPSDTCCASSMRLAELPVPGMGVSESVVLDPVTFISDKPHVRLGSSGVAMVTWEWRGEGSGVLATAAVVGDGIRHDDTVHAWPVLLSSSQSDAAGTRGIMAWSDQSGPTSRIMASTWSFADGVSTWSTPQPVSNADDSFTGVPHVTISGDGTRATVVFGVQLGQRQFLAATSAVLTGGATAWDTPATGERPIAADSNLMGQQEGRVASSEDGSVVLAVLARIAYPAPGILEWSLGTSSAVAAPVITRLSVASGRSYAAPPALSCTATQTSAGPVACRVVARLASRTPTWTTFRFTATATGSTGLVTRRTGTFRVSPYYIKGLRPDRRGIYTLRAGHRYVVVANIPGSVAPRYYAAIKAGPGLRRVPTRALDRMHPDRDVHWTMAIHPDTVMLAPTLWNVGVRTSDGVIHVMHIRVLPGLR